MLNRRATGIIFANMHDEAVTDLTALRSMASLPFGGRYRLIDFGLSCLVNSGVSRVGVVAKENYHSLMDHLGTGRAYDLSRKITGLTMFPPFSEADNGRVIYHGRIGALASVIKYIRESKEPYIILMDCDHVYNIDLAKVLDRHIESGCDVSVLCSTLAPDDDNTKNCVVITPDENGMVRDISVNVNCPHGSYMSMNIFIAGKEQLVSLIEDATSHMYSDFERDILLRNLGSLKVRCDVHDGFVKRICSMGSYYEASMSLLKRENLDKLFCRERPIFTKVRDEAPVRYGLTAKADNNLVADGCVIDGDVRDSVLFRGVKVGKGAVIRNCILMQDTVVGFDAALNYVITDKDVIINPGVSLSGHGSYPLFIKKLSIV